MNCQFDVVFNDWLKICCLCIYIYIDIYWCPIDADQWDGLGHSSNVYIPIHMYTYTLQYTPIYAYILFLCNLVYMYTYIYGYMHFAWVANFGKDSHGQRAASNSSYRESYILYIYI